MGPLGSIRIVDLGGIGPAPTCAMPPKSAAGKETALRLVENADAGSA